MKEDLLCEAAYLLDKAERIERKANPNNEEDYAIALQKSDKIVMDAVYSLMFAIYGKGV